MPDPAGGLLLPPPYNAVPYARPTAKLVHHPNLPFTTPRPWRGHPFPTMTGSAKAPEVIDAPGPDQTHPDTAPAHQAARPYWRLPGTRAERLGCVGRVPRTGRPLRAATGGPGLPRCSSSSQDQPGRRAIPKKGCTAATRQGAEERDVLSSEWGGGKEGKGSATTLVRQPRAWMHITSRGRRGLLPVRLRRLLSRGGLLQRERTVRVIAMRTRLSGRRVRGGVG